MPDTLDIAHHTLLAPANLNESDLEQVMEQLFASRLDAADLYFQASRLESWVLDEGIIREGNYNIEQGVGVRAISGEKTGFAYTDEIHLPSLLEAARTARAIARSGGQQRIRIQNSQTQSPLYPPINPLETLSEQEKVDLLKQLDVEARKQDPRVKQVTVSLVAAHDVVMVASSDGTLSGDVRPMVRCNVHVIVEDNGRREQGSSGGGARQGFQFFIDQERALGYAREAVRQALVNLDAEAAPAGAMTVVLGLRLARVFCCMRR